MRLSRALLLLAVGPVLATPVFSAAAPIEAGVDPRVDLMSIVFRLAEANEYSQGKVPGYVEAVDDHFGAYRDHPVVEYAKALRAEEGIAFDAVMSMAVHLGNGFEPSPRVPFDREGLFLWERWNPDDARKFVDLVHDFAEASRFEAFFRSHGDLHEVTTGRMQAFLEENLDPGWFPEFFGFRPGREFQVLVGLLNGGANYAARFRPSADGEVQPYAIIGVWKVDEEGLPLFDDGVIEILAHEFSHLFVNPALDVRRREIEGPAKAVYEAVGDAMKSQGYGVPMTMIHESVVRAAVILYLEDHDRSDLARQQLRDEESRSFLWMEELVEVMREYHDSRERYPDLEAFLPRIVAFFAGIERRMPKIMEAYEARRPVVEGTVPTDGATAVDPSRTTITIRFDRPIARDSYSVLEDEEHRLPEILEVSLDESGTIFRIEVELEPSTTYGFHLNGPGYSAFMSEEGVPMKPHTVRFTTAEADD